MHLLRNADERIINISDLEHHKVYDFDELALICFNGIEFDYSLKAIAGITEKVKKQLMRCENAL